jgi:soluble lytic murein transglycosylase-like protein
VRKTLSLIVLVASLIALILIVHEQYGERIASTYTRVWTLETFSAARPRPVDAAAPRAVPGEEQRFRALAEFLARKYKVSQDVTFNLVNVAHSAGHQLGLDPLLIMAVIAVESRYNPIAESVAGAKGLMQIIPRYHSDKLEEYGGENAVFDPVANIQVGARILKEYLARTGNLSMALQMYAGALGDDQDLYTTRVMSEKQRLQQVVNQAGARPAAMRSTARERAAADATPL